MWAVGVLGSGLIAGSSPWAAAGTLPVLSSSTILSGTVLRDGRPDRSARVTIVVWPTAQVLAAMTGGASVRTLRMPAVAVNGDGAFAARLVATRLPAGYVDPDGAVDYDAVVADTSAQLTYSSSATVAVDSAAMAAWRPVSGGSGPERITADLGHRSGVATAMPVSAFARPGAMPTAGAIPVAYRIPKVPVAGVTIKAEKPNIGAPCHWLKDTSVATKLDQKELWTYVYGWAGAKVTAAETTGTSHGLGIALKVGSGAWGASGTSTLDEATGSGRTVGGIVDKAIYNRVTLTEFGHPCTGHPNQYRWQATSLYALISDQVSVGHPIGRGCQHYSSGDFAKDNTANITWTNGLDITGVLNVSSHAGWNSSTKLVWSFTAASDLCGNSTLGPVVSWQVEAHRQ